jgi:phosphate transport system protein
MTVHLQRQFENLKKMILTLGTVVEESVDAAIQAVTRRDTDLAQKVIDEDARVDLMEVDVEEECLHTLALYQPVAFDLRFVVSVLKINNDLERIADLSVNIAEQAQFLALEAELDHVPFDLSGMARRVRGMLKRSLDALVNVDSELADSVVKMDDEVDIIHREMYQQIEQSMREEPHHIEQLIHLLSTSRHLERIADHCTNIAEDVIYMARGDIARHSASMAGQSEPAGGRD